FFERLGLNDDNELHRRIYAMMKEEAVEARRRLTANRDALVQDLRNTGIEPPFSHAHISETYIHREILRIYNEASRETRIIYALGHDVGHEGQRIEEENWVIRWMLWHVFRYRDNRNRNRRAPSSSSPGDDDDDDDDDESGDGSATAGPSAKTINPTAASTTRYWDPVRNG
ncbi:hypothetical protein LTR53_016008, partial [Teratosphaeriaceae sp. CCFEE 6253]